MERLAEIEEIKQLKARYFRFLDSKNWTALGDCLVEDVTFSYPPQNISIKGKVALISNFSTRHAQTKTAHTGSMPEIEIISSSEATGVWFMSDYIIAADGISTQGFGHYHETYILEKDHWKIKTILLERLFIVKNQDQSLL